MSLFGVSLLAVGLAALVIGIYKGRRVTKVNAKQNSVAVGGDNHAPITISSHQNANGDSQGMFWTVWNLLSGIASFIGLALTIWPAK